MLTTNVIAAVRMTREPALGCDGIGFLPVREWFFKPATPPWNGKTGHVFVGTSE
jgi:hypothetical protein